MQGKQLKEVFHVYLGHSCFSSKQNNSGLFRQILKNWIGEIHFPCSIMQQLMFMDSTSKVVNILCKTFSLFSFGFCSNYDL